jgi:hypothetical protein
MIAPLAYAGLLVLIAVEPGPFVLDDGAFRADFPREARRRTLLLPVPEGEPIPAVTYRAEYHFLDFYLVHHDCLDDLAPYQARAVLQAARDSLVSRLGGTLLSSREVAVAGHVALEFEVEYLDDGLTRHVRERTCLANGRFYQVMVVGTPVAMARSGAGGDFLRSFSIARTPED